MKTIKKVLLALLLVLIPATALSQGGPFPPPSVTWTNLPLTAPWGSAGTNTIYSRALSYPSYPTGAVILTVTGVSGGNACFITFNFGGTQTSTAITSNQLVTATGITLSNGSLTYRLGTVNGGGTTAVNSQTYASVTPSYTCTTFPTTGTVNIELIPDLTPVYMISTISGNASTILKTNPGNLQSITINNPGATWSVTVFDNTACSGGQLLQITPTVTVTLIYNTQLYTGLCVTTSGTTAGNLTVAYR